MSEPEVTRIAPWYIHPVVEPEAWHNLLTGDVELDLAVVNIDNGPGAADDPYYPALLVDRPETCPALLGYVDVYYGQRPIVDVLRDAEFWLSRYAVTGVLLDQYPSVPEPAFAEVATTLRGFGVELVAANPGVLVIPEVAAQFDITGLVETALAGYQPPVTEIPGAWHLVYNCPIAEAPETIRRAAAAGAQYVSVSDAQLPNPWPGSIIRRPTAPASDRP